MMKYIEEKELCLHSFLIEQLSDELEDAEEYHMFAVKAKMMNDHPTCQLLVAHGKDELKHFEAILDLIEKTIPNIKTNPLYPLLKELDEWADEIEADLNKVR